jgi:hypothetical protein
VKGVKKLKLATFDKILPFFVFIAGLFYFSTIIYIHQEKNKIKIKSQITVTETTSIKEIKAGFLSIYKIETEEEIIYYRDNALFVVEKK